LGNWSYELLNSNYLASRDIELFERVYEWTKSGRNTAVHELVKISEGHGAPWGERVVMLKTIALGGKKLSDEVQNWRRGRVE
jgi:hypothetical protein